MHRRRSPAPGCRLSIGRAELRLDAWTRPICQTPFAFTTRASAAEVSTHLLDLAAGAGASNVPVVLMKRADNMTWKTVATATTDKNGRVKGFQTDEMLSIRTEFTSASLTWPIKKERQTHTFRRSISSSRLTAIHLTTMSRSWSALMAIRHTEETSRVTKDGWGPPRPSCVCRPVVPWRPSAHVYGSMRATLLRIAPAPSMCSTRTRGGEVFGSKVRRP